MKKNRLLLVTFIGVLLSVFAAGFVIMKIALKHVEKNYVELQLESSKRQAENMSAYLEKEIADGVPQDTVLMRLQNSIMGTDVEKGYLCMFDKNDAHLVCHPNLQMVGMQVPSTFKFKEIDAENEVLTTDYIEQTTGGGGIFKTNNGADIAYLQPVEGTDWVLALHQNTELIKTAIDAERKIYLLGSILAGFIIALFATLVSRFISSRYEKKIEDQNVELRQLNVEISQQKEEIVTQKEQIEEQYHTVSEQKNQIMASIQYAKRIQHALLPLELEIEDFFTDSFVYFKPRDVVSGDFYWFMSDKDVAVIVAADSTGHGVPGAFMSMLGIAFFNEIVSQNFDEVKAGTLSSNMILEKMKEKIIISLKQEDNSNSDGMDLAMCIVDKKRQQIKFSGANNPLMYIHNNEVVEIKADRMPIGTYYTDKKFTEHIVNYTENDIFYMFSDGFIDQFGDNNKGKFMKKRFYKLIKDNSQLVLNDIQNIIDIEFNKWKGDLDQIDDVLVIAFKV